MTAQLALAANLVTPGKSLDDLKAELTILQDELDRTQRLINDRPTRSYAVQVFQTGVLLGHKTQADLAQAQSELDESIAAISRKHLLEQSIADQKKLIEDYQFADRIQMVEGIRAEFHDVMDRYKVESKKLLEIHRHLARLDNTYRSIARGSDGLLDPFYRELNLPAVTGSLASRSGFCTGQD